MCGRSSDFECFRWITCGRSRSSQFGFFFCITAQKQDWIGDCEYGELERFASIPEHDVELAENLLFQHPPKQVPAGHSRAELLRNVPADWREQNKEQPRR